MSLDLAFATRDRSDLLPTTIGSLLPVLPDGVVITLVIDGEDDTASASFAAEMESKHRQIFNYRVIPKSGLAAARNTLISMTQSKFIRFQDDDDYLSVEMVMKIHAFHKNNSKSALLTKTIIVGEQLNPLLKYVTTQGGQLFGYEKISRGRVGFDCFWGGRISLPTDQIGENRFDEVLKFGSEDIDFGFRFVNSGGRIFYEDKIYATQIRKLSLEQILFRSYLQGRSQAYIAENRNDRELIVWAKNHIQPVPNFNLELIELELGGFYSEAVRISKLSKGDMETLFGKSWQGYIDFIWGRSIDLAKSIGFESFSRKIPQVSDFSQLF